MEKKEWDNYAKDYHSYILSPFQEKVKNPVHEDIKKICSNKGLVCADVGCGRGDFLGVLSKNFSKVIAVDFSSEMLKFAKSRNKELQNIKFIEADARKLSELGLSVDVLFAINSILHPKVRDVEHAFSEIIKSIKPGGVFIGIFPSMEAVLYNNKLVYENELRRCKDEKIAIRNTKRKVEDRKYNYITGIYEDCCEKQRFFYRFELEVKLKEAGFSDIEFDKVKYPWGLPSGDYDDFFGKPEMWDWYVRARKK